MLFEQCPQAYKARYVDGVVSEPSLAMLFGHTVHTALEVLLQGQRGGCPVTAGPHTDHLECARARYFQEFERARSLLEPQGVTLDGIVYFEGLRQIDQVAAMDLNRDRRSRSERCISIPTTWGVRGSGCYAWPLVGAVDLWCPPWSQHGPMVWDFKTTVGAWSSARAEKETWQPLLYSWAYVRAYDVVPTFRYLVLNRMSGAVNIFDRTWQSRRAFERDLEALSDVADAIAEAVAEGNYDCTKRHGTCLECGEPFGHDHVCRTPYRAPRVHLSGTGRTSLVTSE
jgi:hypothetical protein